MDGHCGWGFNVRETFKWSIRDAVKWSIAGICRPPWRGYAPEMRKVLPLDAWSIGYRLAIAGEIPSRSNKGPELRPSRKDSCWKRSRTTGLCSLPIGLLCLA